jgi:nitrate reductase cytochrome c-type subunit
MEAKNKWFEMIAMPDDNSMMRTFKINVPLVPHSIFNYNIKSLWWNIVLDVERSTFLCQCYTSHGGRFYDMDEQGIALFLIFFMPPDHFA